MFGYVKTDMPNLYVKDTVLYKAVYCGLCKSIGKCSGTRGRLVLNYDLAFLSAFLHNVNGEDFKVSKQRCIIHRIVKRPVAEPDNLSVNIGALNVILAYYKLTDDVIDDNKGKVKRRFIKKAYKKAKKLQPNLDVIVKEKYNELRKLEKENSDSIDMVADPFGNMLTEIVTELIGEKATESVKNVAYNLGKWIYLIDALDDYDKDKKEKNFNVFVNAYREENKAEFIKKQYNDLALIFGTIISEIVQNAKEIKYCFNHDLIDNILFRGIPEQTKMIMENDKCKNTTKF